MSKVIQLPVIAGVEITTDTEGRFNLNALHQAHLAANPSLHRNSKQPADWLKLEGTKELIEEISNSEDLRFSPIESKAGRYGGTFAHELLAVSYAGWISPAFQLKVNQVFLDYRAGKLDKNPAQLSRFEILQLAMKAEEENMLLAAQRDEAVRTKAHISDKKTATAMATAAAQKKRADRLEEELGKNTTFKSTKSVDWVSVIFVPSKAMWSQVGKYFKRLSGEMNYEVRQIEDSAYGVVNAYHIDVITEAYKRIKEDSNILVKYRSSKKIAA